MHSHFMGHILLEIRMDAHLLEFRRSSLRLLLPKLLFAKKPVNQPQFASNYRIVTVFALCLLHVGHNKQSEKLFQNENQRNLLQKTHFSPATLGNS